MANKRVRESRDSKERQSKTRGVELSELQYKHLRAEKRDGYVRRWMNDYEVDFAKSVGWDCVESYTADISSHPEALQKQEGAFVTRKDRDGHSIILMEITEEGWENRRRMKREVAQRELEGISPDENAPNTYGQEFILNGQKN